MAASRRQPFGFDVVAAITRLRDALSHMDPRLATDEVRALGLFEFRRAVEETGLAADEASEAARISDALARLCYAQEEAESPLARLIAMREDILRIIEPCRSLLVEYEHLERAKYSYHFAQSTNLAKDEDDARAHARTTERGARERIPDLELGQDDLCIDPNLHERRCVWPLRFSMALEDIVEAFRCLDGANLFAHPELLGNPGKVRQALFEEVAAKLRGNSKPFMPWSRCAALLVGDSTKTDQVRKAAHRFSKDDPAYDLAMRRARESILRFLDRRPNLKDHPQMAVLQSYAEDEARWMSVMGGSSEPEDSGE